MKGLLIAFIIVLSATACAPQEIRTPGSPWAYTDLKYLAPSDPVPPELDLIATYTRLLETDLQFRLDFLDLKYQPGADIYLAIDLIPGGTRKLPLSEPADIEWDLLAVIPAQGTPYTLYPQDVDDRTSPAEQSARPASKPALTPTISRVPWNDYVVINLNRWHLENLPTGYKSQVFITEPASRSISDSSIPFRNDSPPPDQAPLVLTFWNTFPAYTPAQALRRWDGAHTGPYGERHGLSVLLHSVRRNKVPVILLDLTNPAYLSALDFVGGYPLVKELVDDKLVFLADPLPGSPTYPLFPDGLPEWASRYALAEVRRIATDFSLPSGRIVYNPREPISDIYSYKVMFANVPQQSSTYWQQTRILPIPYQTSLVPQATAEGLSISVRRVLLQNALDISASNGAKHILLILGGSLADSSFGDPRVGDASLAYIAAHPWIKAYDGDDLATLPPDTIPMLLSGYTNLVDTSLFIASPQLQQLDFPGNHPGNPLYYSAWESALAVFAPLPPEPSTLPALRSNYSGQVGLLTKVAAWADNPTSRDNCLTDPDGDEFPDCINANEQIYSQIGISGGRMISLFYRNETGIHQIIAPSTNFVIGLSDPNSWVLEAGEGADVFGYHGAFFDQTLPWDLFYPSSFTGRINLTASDQRIAKTIRLTNDGIKVEIRSIDPTNIIIPLALDPWIRYSPGWGSRYHQESIPGGVAWVLDGGARVEIQSNKLISFSSFIDAYPYINNQENPNQPYPPGHYLPFPMAVARINGSGFISIDVTIK